MSPEWFCSLWYQQLLWCRSGAVGKQRSSSLLQLCQQIGRPCKLYRTSLVLKNFAKSALGNASFFPVLRLVSLFRWSWLGVGHSLQVVLPRFIFLTVSYWVLATSSLAIPGSVSHDPTGNEIRFTYTAFSWEQTPIPYEISEFLDEQVKADFSCRKHAQRVVSLSANIVASLPHGDILDISKADSSVPNVCP